MKTFVRSAAALFFLLSATGAQAGWFWDDDDWRCWGPYGKIPGCNPYDEWDPRYWMEEMEDFFDDDDYYGPGYGPAPYGPPPGFYGRPAPYGPPPGYAPRPGFAPAPYGPPPGYAPPPPPAYGPGYGPGPRFAPPPAPQRPAGSSN